MRRFKLFMALMTFALLSFSCGDDDDNNGQNPQNDVLVFGDTEFQLRTGVIEDYGEVQDGIYNFDISLVDTTVSIVNDELEPDNEPFSGVYFELFTDNPQDLARGTYVFGSNVIAGAFENAEIYINITLEDDINYFEVVSGTFTVLENGPEYEFQFDGTVDDGTEFSGYYRGTLIQLDANGTGNRMSSPNLESKSGFLRNSKK